MPLSKPWYTSSTLWLNIVAVVLAALAAVLDAREVLHLSAQAVAVYTIAIATLNAIVRVVSTAKPIAGSPAEHKLRLEQVRPSLG